MIGYLLDTNAILAALGNPDLLPEAARAAIIEGPNVLSVVSYGDILRRHGDGRLELTNPPAWWAAALDQLAATALPLKAQHINRALGLGSASESVLDRLVVAQAIDEGLTLVSMDEDLKRFAVKGLLVAGSACD